MNPVETVIVGFLKELQAAQKKIDSFVAGEISSSNIKSTMAWVDKILKFLEPLLVDAQALIPASHPELTVVLAWAIKIINQIDGTQS